MSETDCTRHGPEEWYDGHPGNCMNPAREAADDPYIVPVDEDGNAIGTNHQIHNPTIILKPENLRMAPSARIDSFCKLECGEGIHIGELVHIASFVHLGIGGGKLIIQDRAGVSSGAKIITGSNVPGFGHGCSAIDPAAKIERDETTTICCDAIVFSNAVVLPGVTIGANAVLAAGAVATKDVPAFEIWAGVPARKIGDVRELAE